MPDIGDPVEKTDWIAHLTKNHTIESFTNIINGTAYVTKRTEGKELIPYMKATSDGYRVFVVMRDIKSKEEIARWNASFLNFVKWNIPPVKSEPRIVKFEKDPDNSDTMKVVEPEGKSKQE
jgi:hypothetical protein